MEACFLQISNRKYETIHFFQRDLGLTPRQLYVHTVLHTTVGPLNVSKKSEGQIM